MQTSAFLFLYLPKLFYFCGYEPIKIEMKRLNHIILLFTAVLILSAVSCNSTKSDDKTPPKISNIIFNMNDTLFLLDEAANTEAKAKEQGKYIVLNDSLKDPSEPDTVVLGGALTFSARLTDEGDGLSAVLIRIWTDTLPEESGKDSAFYKIEIVPSINMFGLDEYFASKALLETVVPETQSIGGEAVGINQEDRYHYQVSVIDAAGNEGFAKEDKKIRFLSREAVLKAYGKWEEPEQPEEPEPSESEDLL